jgi:hypothetical protein
MMGNWNEILDPHGFYEAFRNTWSSDDPEYQKPWLRDDFVTKSEPTTKWFEKCMQKIAKEHGLHCQNRLAREDGKSTGREWMNVDHVFVPQERWYSQFPEIVVEHENGDFGTKETGKLVDPRAEKASIEWAFWKCLAMRSRLSVLVAYPQVSSRKNGVAKWVFEKMVEGWSKTYKDLELKLPQCLLLLGWMDGNEKQEADSIYAAYTFDKDGKMKPDPLTEP